MSGLALLSYDAGGTFDDEEERDNDELSEEVLLVAVFFVGEVVGLVMGDGADEEDDEPLRLGNCLSSIMETF